MGLKGVTSDYKGLHRVKSSYKVLRGFTRNCMGLQVVTDGERGYRGSNRLQ